MFNLVNVVIAIVLGTVLSLVTTFYGGDSMTEGKITSEATRYRNEASQIGAAVTIYKASGNEIADGFSLQDLIDGGYIGSLPEGWSPSSDSITNELDEDDEASEQICFEANKQSGYTFSSSEEDVMEYSLDEDYGIPYCDKEDLGQLVPCCVQEDS